jgi:lipopolysaccharide transport system ATP-binding protein
MVRLALARRNVSPRSDEITDDDMRHHLKAHPDAPTEKVDSANHVVSAQGLGKRFDIYKNDRGRMFEFFGRRSHHQEHWALKGVDFHVERGRSFGIIGPNGAGKSTLLKLIGGITRPTEGEIRVRARLSTLLDLGLGFHQSFSGREHSPQLCVAWNVSVRHQCPFAEHH